MFNDNGSPNTKYIDCVCTSYGHAIRIACWYEPEGPEFFIAFNPETYPGKDDIRANYKWFSQFFKDGPKAWAIGQLALAKWYLDRFKSWSQGVWWAVRGRPQWWYAEFCADKEKAEQIIKFLQESVAEGDKRVADLAEEKAKIEQ